MTITKEMNGSTAVIRTEGWLDAQTAPELQAVLDSLGEDTAEIVLDFEKLEYISSAGLRLVVAAHKRVGGNLTIIHPSAEILDVLRMTGFDKRLSIK